jgi:CRP/FNR family transcriptional regulator, cyclic AMP receptor protein
MTTPPLQQPKAYLPLLDIENVLPILSKISILGGLTDPQLYTVFRKLLGVSYRAGETVFEQGDRPQYIYIIRHGRVRMVANVDGTPMELVEYVQGQCFGETAAVGIIAHSASALVEEDTDLIVLSGQALHELYHEDPPLFGMLVLNIAREACRRLHKTDEILLHYASRKSG